MVARDLGRQDCWVVPAGIVWPDRLNRHTEGGFGNGCISR